MQELEAAPAAKQCLPSCTLSAHASRPSAVTWALSPPPPTLLTTPSALLSKHFCSVVRRRRGLLQLCSKASCPDFQLDVLAVVSERGQGRAERWERLRPTPKRSSKIKCKQVHRAL